MTPKQDELGAAIVGRRHPTAEGEGVGVIFVPVTDLSGVTRVGTAKRADETLNPVDAVAQRSPAGCGDCESDRFGALPALSLQETVGDL
ncbi:hypothetical protein D3C78_1787540 [compost metagenome]